MGTFVVVGAVFAALLVIASGVWVAVALIGAIGRPERSGSPKAGRTTDNSTTR